MKHPVSVPNLCTREKREASVSWSGYLWGDLWINPNRCQTGNGDRCLQHRLHMQVGNNLRMYEKGGTPFLDLIHRSSRCGDLRQWMYLPQSTILNFPVHISDSGASSTSSRFFHWQERSMYMFPGFPLLNKVIQNLSQPG